MKENTYKPQIPDVMEAIFDAAYLTFDLVAAILFFVYANGNTLFVLYGILTLTLCGGDAFHLVPRIIRAVGGTSDKIKRQLGIGLQVSSITMTVFYIILMYIWKLTFPEIMLMCGKVTHKNLIDNRPLFRYYSSIWIEKTSLIQYNKVSGRYLYEGKNTNH